MFTPPKVLFIGLDSANPDLLAQGCDAGWLPVMQKLRHNGAWAQVRVPRGFGNGAIWPSLFTGVNPGRHGRYFRRQIKPGTYEIEHFAEDADFKEKPLWEHVSQAGRRVAVIDMVKAPLSTNINGIMINDWTAHDRTDSMRTWPAQLASEVTARFGFDPFDGNTDIPKERTADEYKAFRDAVIARVDTKAALCEHYIKQDSWDLFMVVFAEPHDTGHQCWHLHDPTHPMYDAQWVERFGDPVKDLHVALDSAIGRLLDSVGRETTIVVFAGPGMGPDFTGNFLFDQLLRRLDGRPDRDRNLIPHAIVSLLRPAALQRLGHSVNAVKRWFSISRRRCFEVPHNENAGAIRINVVGREPAGCVNPGADYEAFCESLTKDLLEVVNVDTGRPVIQEVIRIADECHGNYMEAFPDLFAIWSREAPIRAVTSPKIGIVRNNPVIGARTGDHTPDCALLVHGPGVTVRGSINPMGVEDIAPTIAALLGVGIPDCDGVPFAFQNTSRAASGP